jgi:hypothetical protein
VAKVLLHVNDNGGIVDLPPVCMKCGAEAATHRPTTFSWHPQWISWILALTLVAGAICLPIAIILALVMTQRVRVEVPLCGRHQHPWLASQIALWGGLALLFVLIVATIFLFAVGPGKGSSLESLPVIAFAVTALYFPIWAVAASIMAQRAIHAALITPREVRLVSVSRQFADAVYDQEEDAYRQRYRADAPRDRMRGGEPDEGYTGRSGPR